MESYIIYGEWAVIPNRNDEEKYQHQVIEPSVPIAPAHDSRLSLRESSGQRIDARVGDNDG